MSGVTDAVPWHVPAPEAVISTLGFAALTAIEAGAMDDHLDQLLIAVKKRRELYDRKKQPSRVELKPAQTWAWMNGPGRPHWEVRGMGARLS